VLWHSSGPGEDASRLRAPDGIVLVDTCPTKEVFDAFVSDEAVRVPPEKHGLPEPEHVDDLPVHAAFVGGQRAATTGS